MNRKHDLLPHFANDSGLKAFGTNELCIGGFTSFSTVLQSYQDNERVIMKASGQ